MSGLHDQRTKILDALEPLPPTVSRFDHAPARMSAPAVMVQPSDPYLTGGQQFGEWTAHHTLTVLVAAGPNPQITQATDDLIETTLDALDLAGIPVSEVGGFYLYEANAATYLATQIRIETPYTLEETP